MLVAFIGNHSVDDRLCQRLLIRLTLQLFSFRCVRKKTALHQYTGHRGLFKDIIVARLGAHLRIGRCGKLLLDLLSAVNGLTAAELAAWAEEARYYIHGYFTLESFDALARGGRIPPAAATVGGKLDIKPELSYDTNGALTLRGMCRGRKKALRAIIADFKANYLGAEGGDEKLPVAIVSADAEKDARWLADQVRREPGCEDVPVIYSSVGPVIGAHVGPGMVALLFWGKDRRESLSFTDRLARKVRGQ